MLWQKMFSWEMCLNLYVYIHLSVCLSVYRSTLAIEAVNHSSVCCGACVISSPFQWELLEAMTRDWEGQVVPIPGRASDHSGFQIRALWMDSGQLSKFAFHKEQQRKSGGRGGGWEEEEKGGGGEAREGSLGSTCGSVACDGEEQTQEMPALWQFPPHFLWNLHDFI